MARRRQRVRSNVSARTGSQPYAGYGLLVDQLTRQGLFSERVEVLIVKGSASTNKNSVNSVSLDVFYKTFLSLSGVGRLNQTVMAHMLEWINSLKANSNSLGPLNKDNNHSDCLKSFMQFLASKQALQYQGAQKRLLDLLIEKNKLSKKTLDFVLKNGEYASTIAAAYEKIKSSTHTELTSALLVCDRRSVRLAQAILENNSSSEKHYNELAGLLEDTNEPHPTGLEINSDYSLDVFIRYLLNNFKVDEKQCLTALNDSCKAWNSLKLQIMLDYIEDHQDENDSEFWDMLKYQIEKTLKELQQFEHCYKENSLFGDWFLFLRSDMANQVYNGYITMSEIEQRKASHDYGGSSTQRVMQTIKARAPMAPRI